MPFKTDTSSGWKRWLWRHPEFSQPGHCPSVIASGLLWGSFSLSCPSCYNLPAPPPLTYARSPKPPLPSPPCLSLPLCSTKSRLWAAEYGPNNSSLSGSLCRVLGEGCSPETQSIFGRGCLFVSVFNPSGTKWQGAGEKAEREKRG